MLRCVSFYGVIPSNCTPKPKPNSRAATYKYDASTARRDSIQTPQPDWQSEYLRKVKRPKGRPQHMAGTNQTGFFPDEFTLGDGTRWTKFNTDTDFASIRTQTLLQYGHRLCFNTDTDFASIRTLTLLQYGHRLCFNTDTDFASIRTLTLPRYFKSSTQTHTMTSIGVSSGPNFEHCSCSRQLHNVGTESIRIQLMMT